jgi:hypothetical protein
MVCKTYRNTAISELCETLVAYADYQQAVEDVVDRNEDSSARVEVSRLRNHDEAWEDSEPETITRTKERLWTVARLRYIRRNHRYRPRTPDYKIEEKVSKYTEKEYLTLFRMTKTSFNTLLDLIGGHCIFRNSSTNCQRSAKVQMWVGLSHLGVSGNGQVFTSRLFSIGEGTVSLYTKRTVTAVLSLQREYIRMPRPDTPEYRRTVDLMRYQFGFPSCLRSVDGTIIPLTYKPRVQGDRYWTRKKNYGLNATAIVDGEARILFLAAGSKSSQVVLF